ncbi:MAG: hypothetical protein JO127_05130 [Caulobacteraceae bacterium]|nr:hypothetical protein [Caulobacteraceae bacterium]
MPQGPAVPMEWEAFLRRIAPLDKTLDYLIDPDDAWLKQEAIQQLVMSLSQGYGAIVHQDLRHPQFFSFLNPIIKSAAPNPDYMYYTAFIEGSGTYRISGWRGTNLFTHFSIGSGFIGVDDVAGPAIGHIDIDELTLGANGAFQVILSAERPAGYEGDWRKLDPRARTIGVREASYDWLNEVDGRYAIERLDGPQTLERPTPEEIAHLLDRLAGFPDRYAKLFVHFVKTLKDQPINTVTARTWSDIGGLPDQTYYEGVFEFSEDEALLFETDVPDKVRYWQVLLADPLFNTIDWEKCQSSLNGHQARLDSDGRFRAVIAIKDPGVANWRDPAGRRKGVVQGRWYMSNSAPLPKMTRVKLAELDRRLPADTPRLSPQARKESLLARFRGAQFRRKW